MLAPPLLNLLVHGPLLDVSLGTHHLTITAGEGSKRQRTGWAGSPHQLPGQGHPILPGTFGHTRVKLCCSHTGMRVGLDSGGAVLPPSMASRYYQHSALRNKSWAPKVREDQGWCSGGFWMALPHAIPWGMVDWHFGCSTLLSPGKSGCLRCFLQASALYGPCTAHRDG